ncbi:hypothetical protein THII_0227 [Thioploca ingrica]|uniref:DUF2281 domain-containing protein n=1 Tax=Thioploca ingrica TaxID=40754 RepID=A0A090ACQ0_9GAMM|nr:hypothetical protein THII_0227 [Thioploca ingrica]
MKVDELQPIIKTILNLSPQEQFEIITILLRNILDIHKVDEIPQYQDDYKITLKAGTAKGLVIIADDFDEPLDDFKDYMP